MQLAKRNIMMDECDDENRHALKGKNGALHRLSEEEKKNIALSSILRVSWVIRFSQLDSK